MLDKTKEPIDFPRHIQLGSNTDEMTELIFWGPCSPPACDAHRNFSILPDADVDDYDDDVQMERAEKRMARGKSFYPMHRGKANMKCRNGYVQPAHSLDVAR